MVHGLGGGQAGLGIFVQELSNELPAFFGKGVPGLVIADIHGCHHAHHSLHVRVVEGLLSSEPEGWGRRYMKNVTTPRLHMSI